MSTSALKWKAGAPLPPLVPKVHVDFGELGIPWYDEEFGLAQGLAHKDVVFLIGDCFRRLALTGGFGFLGDNPIWYWEEGKQKAFYADLAIADTLELKSITAQQLLLACEVVTTTHKAKLYKDTHTQKLRNEQHGVPEFLLLYPDPDDKRILEWFTLINGSYHKIQKRNGHYASRAIPGLVLEPLAQEDWEPGRKLVVSYNDVPFMSSADEYAARIHAEDRAIRAYDLAEAATLRAATERDRADEAVSRAGEAESRAGEAESRAEKERLEKERLLAFIQKMGVDPANLQS